MSPRLAGALWALAGVMAAVLLAGAITVGVWYRDKHRCIDTAHLNNTVARWSVTDGCLTYDPGTGVWVRS